MGCVRFSVAIMTSFCALGRRHILRAIISRLDGFDGSQQTIIKDTSSINIVQETHCRNPQPSKTQREWNRILPMTREHCAEDTLKKWHSLKKPRAWIHVVGPVIFRDRGKVAEFAELPT